MHQPGGMRHIIEGEKLQRSDVGNYSCHVWMKRDPNGENRALISKSKHLEIFCKYMKLNPMWGQLFRDTR